MKGRAMSRRNALCLAAAIGAGVAQAQSGGGYDLHWNTLDAGGQATSGANGYALNGTVAQADAGVPAGGANGYGLRGGFWPGVHEAGDVLFRNGFEAL